MVLVVEAEPEPAEGGQADPVTDLAEVRRERADEADKRLCSPDPEIDRRTVAGEISRFERIDRFDGFADGVGRYIMLAVPEADLGHRHAFDEPDNQSAR